MIGSGIYSKDYTGWFFCSVCDDELEIDGATNDQGTIAYAECPTCHSSLEEQTPSKEDLLDDYLADYNPNN